MIIICSKCKCNLGEKEPLENKNLTHGLCPECMKKYMKELEIKELIKRLEQEPPKK
jgi:hypothetical protein